MARLITKFKYLKPEDRKNVGGYAEYIATVIFKGGLKSVQPLTE